MAETIVYGLSELDRDRLRELLRKSDAPGSSVPKVIKRDRQPDLFRFKCTAACPAYGVMRITATTLDANKWPTFTTAQPNTTFYRRYLVNSGHAALSGGDSHYYGYGTFLTSAGYVLYDSANTPAVGQTWGPTNGAWSLSKNYWGFNVTDAVTGTGSEARVFAEQYIVNHVLGKTNASHAKGASGTINLYTGTLGSETQVTSVTVTAWNRYATVASGKWVECDWVNGGWSVTSAECG